MVKMTLEPNKKLGMFVTKIQATQKHRKINEMLLLYRHISECMQNFNLILYCQGSNYTHTHTQLQIYNETGS